MQCYEAQQLMNACGIDALAEAPPALAAHLAACPTCAAEWRVHFEALSTLADLREDAPTEKEIDDMWQAIATAPDAFTPPRLPRFPAIGRFLAAGSAVAACLVVAFLLGQDKYGPVSRHAAAPNQRDIAQAGLTYASDDAAPFHGRIADTKQPRADSLYFYDASELDRFTRRGVAAAPATAMTRDEAETRSYRSDQFPTQAAPEAGEITLGVELRPIQAIDGIAKGLRDGRWEENVATSTGASLGYVAQTAPPWSYDQVEQSDFVMELGDEVLPSANAGTPMELSHEGRELSSPIVSWRPGDSDGVEDLTAAAAPPRPSARPAISPAPPSASGEKIVKTAELRLEVPEYAPAVREVQALVAEHAAFIADSTSKEASCGALAATFVIRSVPERFEALFAALKQIGKLEAESASAANVTAAYVDIEARIKALRITEERLQELIQSKSFIDRMAALLEVEQEMTRVRSQIEQLQGQLRVMSDQVARSTITVHIHEPPRTVPNATLSVEVPELDTAFTALNAALSAADSRLTSGKTEKRDSSSLVGTYTLSVKLASYGEVLDKIAALGRVERRNLNNWNPRDASATWANEVEGGIALTLFEPQPELPSGSLTVEVAQLDEALAAVRTIAAQASATLAGSNTTQREDGSSTAQIKVRVSAGRFSDLLAQLAGVGRTTTRQIAGASNFITGGAAAAPCNLSLTLNEPLRQVPRGRMTIEIEKFEPARDALSRLINEHRVQVLDASSLQRTDGTWAGKFRLAIEAGRVDRMVTALAGLGRVASREIAGAGLGELSQANPEALGVIELVIGEKAALAPSPDRSRDSVRGRIRDGLAGLYASIGMIAYGLVVMAPWLVLTAFVTWLLVRFWRRRAARRKAAVSVPTKP